MTKNEILLTILISVDIILILVELFFVIKYQVLPFKKENKEKK